MDEFWLSAENPRQKGPICPRTKKKAPERASVSVLFGLDAAHGACGCHYTCRLAYFSQTERFIELLLHLLL